MSKILVYPIIVEHGDDNTAWGITVPDIPGCFSAADSVEDILDNAREAILLHLESLDEVPMPSNRLQYDEVIAKDGSYSVLLVDVDISRVGGVARRINITIPENFLVQIDNAAKAKGKSRSEFLTDAAMREI